MLVKRLDRVGRHLGEHGAATKKAWLNVLERELDYGASWREISIVKMAHRIQKSASSFYQYWYRLEDAVIELADAKLDDSEPLGERHLAVLKLIALGME
jgi:hypothetical protein